jgi:putative membrane protein
MAVAPDPVVLLAVVAGASVYVRGWRRGAAAGPGARTLGELGRFLGALVVLLVALSPAVEEAASSSFAWHMIQHQLLILVVAPLLASSRPITTVARAGGSSRVGPRQGVRTWAATNAGWLALTAAGLHLTTVLAWHLPPLYDAAMADPRLHHLEHLTLLGTAVLAWGAIVLAARDRGARALAAAVGLAMNALAGAGLGVVLLSAPAPLYGWYADLGAVALDHQRVGGALMKVSAVVVYAGAAVWIVTRWLQRLAGDPGGDGAVLPPRPAPLDAGRN